MSLRDSVTVAWGGLGPKCLKILAEPHDANEKFRKWVVSDCVKVCKETSQMTCSRFLILCET